MRSKAGITAILSVLAALTPSAQQPPAQPPQKPPSFSSGTQVVQVDVRVFDRSGRFVTGLTPQDFEVREDGAPQHIVSVSLVGAPSASTAPSAPAAEARPAPSAPTARPPAVWLFVFDTLHLSPGGLTRSRDAVLKFLTDKFHDGDIGGVVIDGKMANNRLTSVRAELLKAVQDLKPRGDVRARELQMREWPRLQDEFEAWRIGVQNDRQALEQAVIRACSEDPDACKAAPPDMQITQKAQDIMRTAHDASQVTLNIVRALSTGLARIPGPKTVVFLSEGFILQDMEAALRDATGLANRAGAHFYTIDARGLDKGSASSSIIDQPVAFDPAGPSNRFDLQEDGTNALAVDTGGMAIKNENNIGRALDVIQQDAGTYYVIGYTPANQAFDGKFRTIDVAVKRPDVKVRARRGYLALQPAMLLKAEPVPPPAASGSGAAADEPRVVSGIDASIGETVGAHAAAPVEPPAAKSLRTTIESHGLVQELQRSERIAPGKTTDLAGRGWAAYQQGDVEHAALYLGQAARAQDAHPWVRYALGLSHLALGHYGDAVAAWEQVRHEVPDFEPVYFNLADGYMLQKDNGAALKVLQDAQTRWPNDSEVWNASGVIEIRRGAIEAAIRSFAKATTVAPNDSLGFFNLAKAHQMRAAQSQRFDSTRQKWVGGEADDKKAIEYYTKYIQMGGPFVKEANQALQVLNWKS